MAPRWPLLRPRQTKQRNCLPFSAKKPTSSGLDENRLLIFFGVFFKEKTVYQIGTHHSGLQVGEVEYARKSGYKIYSVDQFIAEHRTEEDDGETPDLSGLS